MEKNFMSSKEKNITFYQVWEWIQKNRAIVLAIIPLLGSLLMGIMRVAFRYYMEGQASYFHIPEEQIIQNYPSGIVSMLSGGIIGSLYILCNIWSVRSILKQKTILKKIKRLAVLTVFVPLGILIVVNALILPDKSWGKEFIFGSLSIIIAHAGCTIGIGGFIFHFVHSDLVDFSKISLGIEEKIKKSILKKKINMKQKESEENTEDTGRVIAESDSSAFSTPGNAQLVDDKENDDTKQFLTIQTKKGNTFYMVIDRSSTSENVYMMSLVDENDLAEFLDETEDSKTEEEQKVVIPETTTETTPAVEKETEETTQKNTGSADIWKLCTIVLAGGLGIGAVVVYLKYGRKKEDGFVNEQLEFTDGPFINEEQENEDGQED